jgi:hypothetical protein
MHLLPKCTIGCRSSLLRRTLSHGYGGEAGRELLKAAPEDLLQRWAVSTRVNSSKAPVDDPTLIEQIAI